MKFGMLLSIVLFILFNSILPAQNSANSEEGFKQILKLSGNSEVKVSIKDEIGLTKINQTEYLYGWRFNKSPGIDNLFIISQEINTVLSDMREGVEGHIKATCYVINKKQQKVKNWVIEDDANIGRLALNNSLYETIQLGCCAGSDFHKLYSPETGRLILGHSGAILKTEIPNFEGERYIGFKDCSTYDPSEPNRKDRLYVGTLTYACGDSAISKYIIRAASEKDMFDLFALGKASIRFIVESPNLHVLEGNNFNFWNSILAGDRAVPGGYSICLKFFNKEIVIPVKNDDFDVSGVKDSSFKIIKIYP